MVNGNVIPRASNSATSDTSPALHSELENDAEGENTPQVHCV